MVGRVTSLIVALSLPLAAHAVTFTPVSVGLEAEGLKFGGLAWADFDEDGCLDVLVHLHVDGDSGRLYRSDCNLPDPQFTDITATHAAGLAAGLMDRSVVWADVNHDGWVDFARTGRDDNLQIFLNNGPAATPPYSFGDALQEPTFQLATLDGGINPEGAAWIDVDGDGWLDLMFENGEGGVDVLGNPADGTADMTHLTTNADPHGLPTGTDNGDYAAAADLDVDGDVDWIARKSSGVTDMYFNDGAGTFTAGLDFGAANNNDKGGVLFCDLDSDGDFDLVWTSPSTTQIWQQDGLGSATFTGTGIPAVGDCNADGVDCGDVDNDGDLDLFFSCNEDDQLWLNDGVAGTVAFTRDDSGIVDSSDGEGAVFADYDNDGDLDLLVNQTDVNQLWRNDANDLGDDAYLVVRALQDLGGGLVRDAIGSTVRLLDYGGNPLGPVQEVNGGKGHGSQKPSLVHFGLGSIGDVPVVVDIRFPSGEVVQRAVLPSDIPFHQQVEILHTDVPDSDGDGIPDGIEILDGTDPLDDEDPLPGDDDDSAAGDDDDSAAGDDDDDDAAADDDDAVDDDDASSADDDDASIGPSDDDRVEDGTGCGCSQEPRALPAVWGAIVLVGVLIQRRRR
jgi:hypothetical protein